MGSSGFIGSALSSHLKSQQIECVDLDLRTEEISDKSLGHVIYAIGEPNFKEKPIQSIDAHVLKLEKFLQKANFESFLYLSSTRIYYGSTSTDEDSSLLVNPLKFDNLYNISKIIS